MFSFPANLSGDGLFWTKKLFNTMSEVLEMGYPLNGQAKWQISASAVVYSEKLLKLINKPIQNHEFLAQGRVINKYSSFVNFNPFRFICFKN